MNLVLEISDVVEQRLRAKHADIERSAKEALLIELYRQDELSHRELGQALGLDRIETDALLKRHHVTEDLMSASEYRAALLHLGVSLQP